MVETKKKDFFKTFSFKIIGDFICYRHGKEKQLNILKPNDRKFKKMIDLEGLIKDIEEKQHITYEGISKDSFLHHRLTNRIKVAD